MEVQDELTGKSDEEIEEWFLGSLSEQDIPLNRMIDLIREHSVGEDAERSGSWMELLLDELIERGARADAMRVLKARIEQQGGHGASREFCRDYASRIFDDRVGKILVENCGFADGLPPAECLRRLELLSSLDAGVMCYEKTWGFGLVKRVDEFYKKITIDFTKKAGHQMSFAYAAESLALIDDEHLLAVQHSDPDRLTEMVKDRPGELAKLALKSMGEMSPIDLQECLAEYGIVPEEQWKKFWDKARKELGADPLVSISSKRKEPIRLLDSEQSFDSAWFERFAAERDIGGLLAMMEELQAEHGVDGLDDAARDALVNRVSFALKADEGSNPGRLARTIVIAEKLGLEPESIRRDELLKAFYGKKEFVKALSELPVRFLERFVSMLADFDREQFTAIVLGSLPGMPLAVMNATLDRLTQDGNRQGIIERLRSDFSKRKVAPGPLLWLARQDDILQSDETLTTYNLLVQMLVSLDGSYNGMQLKLRNQVAGLFEQAEWLRQMLDRLDAGQREDILKRVKTQAGVDLSTQRSILAKMIKMYPELEALMAGSEEVVEPARQTSYTSYRSYREKQAQLRKLADEDIPANSKEIGIARSYGDLRENAEYETARQNQALLMKRKAEFEQDLARVQATDFNDFPTNAAGMGTCVSLEGPAGDTKSFNILGEWDSDEQLNIISSRSKLAEVLSGCSKGDELELPGREGEYKVISVTGLSDDVKAWIKQE